jgi:WD40 repeat protein
MGTYGQQAILWDTSTGWIRWNGDAPWSNAPDGSVAVAFSPDGRQVLVGVETAGIAVLDAATGKRLRDISGEACEDDRDGASAVAFSPDGRLILAALSWVDQPMVAIWDARSGKRMQTLRGPKAPADQTNHAFNSIAISPDGRHIVAGSWEGTAVLWDATTGKILRQYQSNSGGIDSVAISHDGLKLLTGTAESKAILWDIDSGKQLRTLRCTTDEYEHHVSSVAFSPDDRRALAGADKSTFLFDVSNGATLRIFGSSDNQTYAVAFSPDGQRVLAAGSRDWESQRETKLQEAVCWEMATGKRVQTLPSPKDAVRSLAFDADGKRLTVGYEDDRATVWDMSTGKPSDHFRKTTKEQKKTPQAGSGGLDPFDDSNRSAPIPDEYKSLDGRWLVRVAEHNTVVLRDRQGSKESAILESETGLRPIIRVAFSAKTSRFAVADEASVHVFNPETGKELATLISAYCGRDWLVTTPGSFFDGSPGGCSLVRWRVGEAQYPFEHFEKQLHRPDMVAKILQEKPEH